MSSHFDKEKVQGTIKFVLDRIKTETDTSLLGEYYDLFKKEVSLFNRSKAAAVLLMLYDQGKSPGNYNTEKNFPRAVKNEKQGAEEDSPRYPLPEEESKRLFFSIGRSRRIFPREILGLINTRAAVTKEDIGAIRILDNYSFVQVRDTVAEKIIGALNDTSFRGRPLTVNYAKSRRDEENVSYSSEEDHDHSEEEDI